MDPWSSTYMLTPTNSCSGAFDSSPMFSTCGDGHPAAQCYCSEGVAHVALAGRYCGAVRGTPAGKHLHWHGYQSFCGRLLTATDTAVLPPALPDIAIGSA